MYICVTVCGNFGKLQPVKLNKEMSNVFSLKLVNLINFITSNFSFVFREFLKLFYLSSPFISVIFCCETSAAVHVIVGAWCISIADSEIIKICI